jgi:hypothetical protein
MKGIYWVRGSQRFWWTNQITYLYGNESKRFSILFFFLYFWCFNATFNNISAISWLPDLAVEEAGALGANHRPWASNW